MAARADAGTARSSLQDVPHAWRTAAAEPREAWQALVVAQERPGMVQGAREGAPPAYAIALAMHRIRSVLALREGTSDSRQ